MRYKLSEDDALSLLNKEDGEAKLAVAQKICREYLSENYSDDEIKIAEEIFRLAIRDAELKVRLTISEALKEAEHLPHDIAMALARDVEEVAQPIIEHSPVLNENDLFEILESSSIKKIIAISRRKNLTKILVEKLVKHENKEILDNLIECNEIANTDDGFESIINSVANNRDAIKHLISTVSLPPKLAETLITNSATQMIDAIKKRYDFTPGVLDKVAGHTIELSTLAIINEQSSQQEVDALIDHLFDFNRLTTSLIISSLCICKMRFFFSALSKRSGIDKVIIRQFIEMGSEEELKRILTKAEMPEKLHTPIKIVLDFIIAKRKENPKLSTKECSLLLIKQLEYHNDRGGVEYLNYLLAIAKQNLKTPIFGG